MTLPIEVVFVKFWNEIVRVFGYSVFEDKEIPHCKKVIRFLNRSKIQCLFACSKPTMETSEHCVKSVQS